MTRNNPTIGGKGKPAKDAPPKFTYIPQVRCDCGRTWLLPGITPETTMIVQPCACGAMIRYFPRTGGATIEAVE